MTVASPSSRPRRPPTPGFPSISLADAIERVRVLYGQAHRRRMSREEIARHLGYGGINGAAVPVIANLARYGLTVGRGDAITVSDDAVTILVEPAGSPDRAAAMRRVALNPALFAELSRDFAGPAPIAENAVRVRLERRGFPPQAAQAASRAFRETMELVEAEGSAYNEPGVASQTDDQGGSMETRPIPVRHETITTPPPPAHPEEASGVGVLWLKVPFQGTALSVRIEASGQALKKEHVARVRKYLELAEADLETGGGASDS